MQKAQIRTRSIQKQRLNVKILNWAQFGFRHNWDFGRSVPDVHCILLNGKILFKAESERLIAKHFSLETF